MPVYEFFCGKCNAIDEVVRPISESSAPYICPDCGSETSKRISAPNIQTEGEQIPYLHPAFGTVLTDRQAKEEAKRRGWVEVGNDKQNSISPPERKEYDI